METDALQQKVDNLGRTSNDKMIAMKIAKFCKNFEQI